MPPCPRRDLPPLGCRRCSLRSRCFASSARRADRRSRWAVAAVSSSWTAAGSGTATRGSLTSRWPSVSRGFGIGEDEMSLPPTTDGTGEGGLGGTASEPGGAGNEALGAGGLSTGDMRRQRDALLAHHNERGGVAGRRIEASAIVGRTRLRPERQPGIDRYRLGAFFERCTCFECTSDWRAAR